MNASEQRTTSLWIGEGAPIARPSLAENRTADVVVVGTGIAGLSVAYELALKGKRVVVLDAGEMGGGMTARTTAHISDASDDWWHVLVERRGVDDARLALSAYRRAIERIAEIARQDNVECSYKSVSGFLFVGEGCDPAKLNDELEACRRLGMAGVEKINRLPGVGFEAGPALHFPNQARFDPVQYLEGLTRGIEGRQGKLYANTRVVAVQGGSEAYVETATGQRVDAGAVVVATNSPINDLVAVHTKQAPYRTYAIAAEISGDAVSDSLFWDTEEPYHYVRLHERDGRRWIIVGGEDHKTGQADDGDARFARLEAWARRRFANMGAVTHRWSGQVLEPVDGLAYIGRNPLDADNVYVATGDSGMGISHGVVAGLLICDLILGQENQWEKVFAPNRVTPGALKDYVAENANVVAQFKDYFAAGEIKSTDELRPGSGGLLRSGLRQVAAYRDAAGVVHQHSAICPHIGCIVHWNSTEGCWDCPCHGSQFSGEGKVLNGPASRDLTKIE